MRLVFELTVPMPLSVEEQRVGQRFVVMEVMYRYVFKNGLKVHAGTFQLLEYQMVRWVCRY